jgi:signal transduction histidine kinase
MTNPMSEISNDSQTSTPGAAPTATIEHWASRIREIHYNLVHDLRAPVAAAYSSVLLLQEDDLDEDTRKQLLGIVLDSLQNALRVLDVATDTFDEAVTSIK